ncbi:MAG: hydantoinase/oxoprolinase family protein [Acidobacteriota bacterium]
MMAGQRLAVDVGGTFTDLVLLNEADGSIQVEKEPSQIGEIADHMFRGLERLGTSPAEVGMILHGSTVTINTILQSRGARVGILTTQGFRDVLELGRGNRPEVYNLLYKPPVPLVPRYLRCEVPERMSHRGEVLTPLDEEATEKAALALRQRGVEGIAICFLNAYANPAHERQAREVVQNVFPQAEVSIASEITGEWREFERTSTVALNTYVLPRMKSYVGGLEERLEQAGFRGSLNIIQSTGGMLAASESRSLPIRTLESGPAGGVIGSVALGRLINEPNLITADVGGTTFDVGLVQDGRPLEESQTTVNRRPVLVPTIDIASVGAGGGSIAWIDDAGGFRVGPLSAEADPGPVCFGRGGREPTVTDAHVVLGRINPDNFLGRRMQLDMEAARQAIQEKIATPLGLELEEAAHGITQLADTGMIHAIRRVTIERGHDPRDLALLCYGGGGGLFAAPLAAELQIARAIVPVNPSVFSAWGILNSDYREDVVLTRVTATADLTAAELEQRFDGLTGACLGKLESSGVDINAGVVLRFADMRYDGQEHTVRVPVPAADVLASDGLPALIERFEQLHERTYGHASPGHPTEVVNLRVAVSVAVTKPVLSQIEPGNGNPEAARRTSRRAYFREAGGWVDTEIYDRSGLRAGDRFTGPAIVEEWSSTTLVPPGQALRVDPYGNLIIRREEAA